ncbi:MAG: AIR synthase-related protein [Longimicrobiales bacterium]|nr:AIR synthase-related protein [Longimicrobiales bacterium]
MCGSSFLRPPARHDAMARLRETQLLSAGMDLSDGLARDAAHLAAASGVRVVLERSRVPVLAAAAVALGEAVARDLALAGGEDYELLIAARPGLGDRAAALDRVCGTALTRVGRIEVGEGVVLEEADGRPVPLPAGSGFDHFPAPAVAPRAEGGP